MLTEFLLVPAFQQNLILIIIFFYQSIYICFGYCIYRLGNLINRISIHFPAELNLCFYLITFGISNVTHIISNTHHTDMAAFYNAHCGTHPGCNLSCYNRICPMSNNNFSVYFHTAYNVSIFTITMCRLVFIHEIHINGIVRKLFIKLGM